MTSCCAVDITSRTHATLSVRNAADEVLTIHPLLGAAPVVALTFSTAAASKKDVKVNPAVTPVPQSDFWLQQRHEGMNARVKQGHADLIFIGDSITHGWDGAGMGGLAASSTEIAMP